MEALIRFVSAGRGGAYVSAPFCCPYSLLSAGVLALTFPFEPTFQFRSPIPNEIHFMFLFSIFHFYSISVPDSILFSAGLGSVPSPQPVPSGLLLSASGHKTCLTFTAYFLYSAILVI